MATVNVYLTFAGDCAGAFNFYKSVLGGEFTYISRFKDMPVHEGMLPVPDGDKEKILHVALPVSKETVLMGSDVGEERSQGIVIGNNFSVSVSTESKAEADKFFNGLSAGGLVTMAMSKTFWGAYFGMFTDKFGINWMINFDELPQHG